MLTWSTRKNLGHRVLLVVKSQNTQAINTAATPVSTNISIEDTYATWKDGKVSGLQKIGIVATYIKKYLRIKFGNKCCLCGWSKVNQKTGLVPLVADHIDGNWRNNLESNLRLLCPNCDSLTSTYAGSNRGNGRKQRALSNRAKEARLLADSAKKNRKIPILSFTV